MSANSIPKADSRKAERPPKPYPDFPLYAHPLGYWSKKINGTIRNFGRWGRIVNGEMTWVADDGAWANALKLFNAQKDDLYAGRKPRVRVTKAGEIEDDTYRVKHLCNEFLTAKKRKLESGELGSRMYQEYRETTDMLVAAFDNGNRPVDDLDAGDFEALRADMAKRWGPIRLANAITRIKSVFKYGLENGRIDRPVRFGSEFKKPDKAVLRRHRAANGEKMLEAEQVRKLIDAAPVSLKAAILLGVNAAFGNHDVATLPVSALDLDGGWVNFPRPKTGIARRCPLWPETVAAIREAIAARPTPKKEADKEIVFLMASGRRWVRNTEKSRTDNLSVCFGELLKEIGARRQGTGFYVLRHVFRTIADAARDSVAIDLIMGHSDPSMAGHYRERIDDARLVAVAEHVHNWLWPLAKQSDAESPGKPKRQRKPRTKSLTSSTMARAAVAMEGYEADSPHPALRLYVG